MEDEEGTHEGAQKRQKRENTPNAAILERHQRCIVESKEWHALHAQIRAMPGGGPSIAELFSTALSQPSLCAPHAVRLASVLEAITWEKLHSGVWRDVSVVWRDAYAVSCILLALGEVQVQAEDAGRDHPSPSDQQACRLKAIRHLDMGLLMGGPLFRTTVIQPCIDDMMTTVTQQKGESGGEDDFEHWMKEECGSALSLPPYSLGTHPPSPLNHTAIKDSGPLSTPLGRIDMPSLETFATDYFLPHHPVIITGAMASWPALAKWRKPSYWYSVAGPRTVPIELGRSYMDEEWGQRLMPFSEFLDSRMGVVACKGGGGQSPNSTNSTTMWYLAQHDLLDQIPCLCSDIIEPEYCCLSTTMEATTAETITKNVWMGPGGTVTPPHTDPRPNLLCQVVGKKYVRLYSPDQGDRCLYPDSTALVSNTSPIDIDDVENYRTQLPTDDGCGDKGEEENGEPKYPLFAMCTFMDGVLEPGDMLFIPRGWWHFVKSLSPSISVNFWFE